MRGLLRLKFDSNHKFIESNKNRLIQIKSAQMNR